MNLWFPPSPEVAWDHKIFELTPNTPTLKDTEKATNDQTKSQQMRSTQDGKIISGKHRSPPAQLKKPPNFMLSSPRPFPTADLNNIRASTPVNSVKLKNSAHSLRFSPVPFPTAAINNIRASTPTNTAVRQHLHLSKPSDWLTL